MAVNYTQALSPDLLHAEMADLVEWQSQLFRIVLGGTGDVSPLPRGFINWYEKESARGVFDSKPIEKLLSLHDEINQLASTIALTARREEKPSLETIDSLTHRVEAYAEEIKRLGLELSAVASLIDPVTGLRTVSGMRNELKREQDRLDRKGTSYSLAYIAVDDIQNLLTQFDRKELERVYGAIGMMIAQAVRSFDDAYFLGKGEFLVCLKHIEFMDAGAVTDRLCRNIEEAGIYLREGSSPVTVSIGVAEALPKEDVDAVMDNARRALREAIERGGNRSEAYQEMSALQKFVIDTNPL